MQEKPTPKPPGAPETAGSGDGLGRDAIAAHPGFFAAEKRIAELLLDVQARTPRMARLLASNRKWLFTHAVFALTVANHPDGTATTLTPGQLHKALQGTVKVNRNTLGSFLAELEAYGFLTLADRAPDGRARLFSATPLARQGMRRWYDGHLACLDLLDGGARLAASQRHPALIFHAQPLMFAHILRDAEWQSPPPSMACFLGTDVGGMLVHYMISRLRATRPAAAQPGAPSGGRLMLEEIGTAALAAHFMISVSSIKRMISRAEAEGWLGWEHPRRRGRLWVSPCFVEDHFRRQAIKFEIVDRAFHAALNQSA